MSDPSWPFPKSLEPAPEGGWFIAQGDTEISPQRMYFSPSIGRKYGGPLQGWSADMKDAIGFARKQDAEQFALCLPVHLGGYTFHYVRFPANEPAPAKAL